MKPYPEWLVPIGGKTATISVDDRLTVQLALPDVDAMTSLEACQLGMALTDASKFAGQLAARRNRR